MSEETRGGKNVAKRRHRTFADFKRDFEARPVPKTVTLEEAETRIADELVRVVQADEKPVLVLSLPGLSPEERQALFDRALARAEATLGRPLETLRLSGGGV